MNQRGSAFRKFAAPLIWMVAVLVIIITPAKMAVKAQNASLDELWLDLRLGPPLIPLFNEIAREDDIARVDNPNQLGQLRGIANGRKMVIIKSVAEAEEFLPGIAGDIDIIGYNLEHNPASAEEDKADPLEAVKRMRELADDYNLQLAFGPDHDFALSHGVEVAPYADIFVLQIQRQQNRPQIVADFVEPLVPLLREANPDLEISVQVRTEGDVDDIIKLLDSLKQYLDGISVLTSPNTVPIAEALLASLRPAPASPWNTILAVLLSIIFIVVVYSFYRRRMI